MNATLLLLALATGQSHTFTVENKIPTNFTVSNKMTADDAAAAPTPHEEIVRVLALMPKPTVGFVDFGCGADARWCIAAAKRWGCRATGVEIDPERAAAAKVAVQIAGVNHLVTIIEGDAITTDVQADVGVAYLYAEVLEKMRPRIEKLRAFASYMHQPPGLTVSRNGDSWFYFQPKPVALASPVVAASWNGRAYTGPVCNNPNCAMCNAIRAQLAAAQPQMSEQFSSGHWVKVKHCFNGNCWYEDVWVADR